MQPERSAAKWFRVCESESRPGLKLTLVGGSEATWRLHIWSSFIVVAHSRMRSLPIKTIREICRARTQAEPWNKGKIIWQKPPLLPKHVWAIRTKLQMGNRARDLALFNLAIDSKLRGCDVVRLRIEDVASNEFAIERAIVRQKKTGRPVKFELTEQTRDAVNRYLSRFVCRKNGWLFSGRGPSHLTTRQYARLVGQWVESIDLDPAVYGTHSLRCTKATLIYKQTGNLRAVQLLLGHAKIESTVRYLGIEVDDALEISEKIDI